ncbi:peptidase domain-containing ABC transporter [Photobacterium sp. J15]|uniref:peptidase domain-containing ABC transporter n=1 Tax=Photobacterium sp. J15 TaxID=265901 RepID=UPI0007E30995|nr:type I secretion system permease/ATPase [Photobacterium sp. J15]
MSNKEQSLILATQLLLKVHGVRSLVNFKNKSFTEYLSDLKQHEDVKLKSKKVGFHQLDRLPLPCIIESQDEAFILAGIKKEDYLIQRPSSNRPEVISLDTLKNSYQGKVYILKKKQNRFNIRWFVPAFLEHKRILGEILSFSFALQILALVSPLFFQVVMDKVLVHHAWETLDVLVFGLVVTGICEVLLKGLREYLYAHTVNRIDIQLGLKLVRHVLGLPLLYFKSRQVGAIVMRVRELNTIREFLTGSMFTLLVDVLFMGVFLYVMYTLSPTLTGVFCLSIPCYVVLTWWLTPRLQKRVEEQFTYSAINTSFLTESVSGAETVKSLAVESRLQRRWDSQTEDMVEASFQTQLLNNKSSHLVQLFQKVISIGILYIGATHVLDLRMTIGQLIAFNMMANHISQPLARIVELWRQYIQARIGVEKLGEMLNLPVEQASGASTPEIRGDIIFHNVTFRYQAEHAPIIENLTLVLPQGQTLGIVGTSGSGKSTLARLLLRLYQPEQGKITLNRHPLNAIDIHYLRQKVGVVLQESFLFNKTVKENIAQSKPSASLEEVVHAAKLAGAHDFILKLPMGYDTELAEGGASLSGGQKQRIAIARTLLTQPDVLILDEATSALDDESQALIQENMKELSKGRTVITIAHRLSTIRNCDRIIVMNKGKNVEQGTHEQLLTMQGQYTRLWVLQQELKKEAV